MTCMILPFDLQVSGGDLIVRGHMRVDVVSWKAYV